MKTIEQRERDERGRFTHVWGWQGFDSVGREWAACEHCPKWRFTGPGQTFKYTFEPAALKPSPDDWKH